VNAEEPILTTDQVVEALGPELLAGPERERRRPIDHLFGSAVFVLILVAAAAVAAGVSAASLLGREETARRAWERVLAQQQRREALVAESLLLLGSVGSPRTVRNWENARADAAGARTPAEEVAAARTLDMAFGDLFPRLRQAAAGGPPEAGLLIERLEGTVLLLEVERGRYDRAVASYLELSQRVPGRWVARLFGLRPLEPWTAAAPPAGAEPPPAP
jgi:LemA protein